MPFRRRSTSKIRHLDVSAYAVESIVIDYDGAFKWCHVVSFAYCIPDAKLSLRPCLYKQSRIIKVPAQSGPFHCCFPSNKGGGRSIFLRHILFKHQQSTTFKGKGKEGIPLRMSGTKPWFCHPPVGIIKTIKVLCHTSFKWLDIYRIFQQQPNPSRSNHLQARYSRVLLSSAVYTYLFHLSYMYVSFFSMYIYSYILYIYIYHHFRNPYLISYHFFGLVSRPSFFPHNLGPLLLAPEAACHGSGRPARGHLDHPDRGRSRGAEGLATAPCGGSAVFGFWPRGKTGAKTGC